MSSSRTAYICAGFYPLDADDMMHAAHLFAVWQARRKYGAAAECKLLIQTELKQEGARFEAVIAHRDRPGLGEPFHFTVVIDRSPQN
jgi:hypothetical protein